MMRHTLCHQLRRHYPFPPLPSLSPSRLRWNSGNRGVYENFLEQQQTHIGQNGKFNTQTGISILKITDNLPLPVYQSELPVSAASGWRKNLEEFFTQNLCLGQESQDKEQQDTRLKNIYMQIWKERKKKYSTCNFDMFAWLKFVSNRKPNSIWYCSNWRSSSSVRHMIFFFNQYSETKLQTGVHRCE